VPDWSYRTILRPLMLTIGAERSRRLAVATLRTLSRSPLGLKAIDFLGHMRRDDSPLILGAMIDPKGEALPALARFGAGMIEVGPVGETANDVDPEWRVDLQCRTIEAKNPIVVSVDDVQRNLERAQGINVAVRLAEQDDAAAQRIVDRLEPYAAMFVTTANIRTNKPVVADLVRGVTEPEEIGNLQLVAIDAGLVLSGPGLLKRCNDALASTSRPATALEPLTLDAARRSWFWAFLMGVAMFLGGVMAVIIASTRVVLPYDESLCGLTRDQMASLNPRLLPFMAHDRVSLAGAMLSIGIFYAALGWSGVRRGQHWAQVTVVVSAMVGFFSFFSFLGFGYFDPFHAFVTAILTQFTLLCMVLAPSPAQPPVAEWRESAAWRRGQWGQLLFIFLGIGLTGAGIVMTIIGCTRVFVQTDLEFMRTTAAQLALSYDRLIPLVAHDRASLGGMLIANGIAVWLSAQWGFRAGARWLWLALAWGGNIAFFCATVVHFVVGYASLFHLTPALGGWLLWNVALLLTREWLGSAAADEAGLRSPVIITNPR
jgi:hypothetical protein